MENGGNASADLGTDRDSFANESGSADHLLTTPVLEVFAEGIESWTPDLIIYHDRCADGIVAAWACWKRWGDTPQYFACNYGHTPPYSEAFGCNVLIVDFSFPAEQLEAMVKAGAKSIVILDHHKTAQAALEPFRLRESSPGAVSASDLGGMLHDLEEMRMPPIVAIFDMDRSGARMAWDFAMPGQPLPRLVELAERYDLWRFQPGTMDRAELLHLVIQSAPLTIEQMASLSAALDDGDGPLIEGAAIYDWRAQLIEEIGGRAHFQTIAKVPGVIAVECPYSLVSVVGHYLLNKHPDAPFAAMSVTGEHSVTWSLRSHDDRLDVSEIAKSMGGGGHRNAAGFKVEIAPDVAPVALGALRSVKDSAFDHYTARNGRRCSIEGDDGEKCWIIPADTMTDVEHALKELGA